MKPIVLLVSVAFGLAAGSGLVIAETTPPAPKAAAAPAPAHDHAAAGHPAGSEGMMCGKMMGGGMNPMMGDGMNPMMMGAASKVTVKNIDKGVTMTFTADDPATVARLQKMAEAMRLMHEAMADH